MGISILKVDRDLDLYVVWSTSIDGPTMVGARNHMIMWLQSPAEGRTANQAKEIMRRVDDSGTSDRSGRFGWDDLTPMPVGETISPEDGWYQIARDKLPLLVDAIANDDVSAAHRLLTRYA